jgi:hypothetical protein
VKTGLLLKARFSPSNRHGPDSAGEVGFRLSSDAQVFGVSGSSRHTAILRSNSKVHDSIGLGRHLRE